ncbi:MAG: hypothetical protein QGH37_20065 [Candidatus Poribacteria bacterium]|nr:hypothetical protein [Candidatus Poribacteria bacterium]MDP6962163.1 hypothetical protein [Dehalococcoidia bacterium]
MERNSSTNKIRNYLESLTRDELINLILKFAPQSLIDNISSQFARKKEPLTIFNKTSKTIDKILSDEDLLYNPSEFGRKLSTQLEKLRGLWDKLPSQIGNLIIRIVEDVEQSFEDGYLYIEEYGEDDDYFESEDVNDYVIHFVNTLPKEIKFDYVKKLKETLNDFGYSTFMSIERKLFKTG